MARHITDNLLHRITDISTRTIQDNTTQCYAPCRLVSEVEVSVDGSVTPVLLLWVLPVQVFSVSVLVMASTSQAI